MWHDTIARLATYSDPTEFERLCADLLVRFGFTDIIPRGPSRQDGGADATRAYFPHDQAFQFSLQRTWKRKLVETVAGLTAPGAQMLSPGGSLFFVTNQAVPPLARDKLTADIWSNNRVRVTVFDREWLRLQLDLHQDIRAKFLGLLPDPGYRPVIDDAGSRELALHLALPDFVRQLFTLAVMRSLPYRPFLDLYFDLRLAPAIKDHHVKIFGQLLPVDRSGNCAKRQDKIAGPDKAEVLYPIADQTPDLPGLVTFWGTDEDNESYTPINIPLMFGRLVFADTELNRSTEAVWLISLYCGTQFRRLQVDAMDRLGVDYAKADRIIAGIMRALRQRLGKSWAEAFSADDEPENLRLMVEWSWAERSLELTLPFFLSNFGLPAFRRVLARADYVLLERLAMSLADERVPLQFRRAVYDAARQRPLNPEFVQYLAQWTRIGRRMRIGWDRKA